MRGIDRALIASSLLHASVADGFPVSAFDISSDSVDISLRDRRVEACLESQLISREKPLAMTFSRTTICPPLPSRLSTLGKRRPKTRVNLGKKMNGHIPLAIRMPEERLPNPHRKHILTKSGPSRRREIASVLAATAIRGGGSGPALAVWIGPALVCALAYALYNLCIKKSSASIDPILGGVLLQFVAALVGTVLLVVRSLITARDISSASASSISAATVSAANPIQRSGLLWALAAGLAVGCAEILSFLISGMGAQAMQTIPITVGGSIVFGTVLGRLWLREALTLKGWFGILLIALGIALVAMDPGSSLH